MVDDDEVSYSDPSPLPGQWQLSQYAVMCNITVSDSGGAQVDLSTNAIQYRYRSNEQLYFSEWETFWYNSTVSSIENLNGSWRLMTLVNFPGGEGTENAIQWRARDTVGNGGMEGFTESEVYTISIDSYPVVLSDPYPSPEKLDYEHDLTVRAAITFEDNGTGVDGTNMSYRFSIHGASDELFSDWTALEHMGNASSLRAEVDLKLRNGNTNYVQWRCRDVAGNRVTSQKYQIKVDDSLNSPPLPPTSLSPNETADRTPHLRWEGASDPEGDPLRYEIAIGIYDPDTLERLPVVDQAGTSLPEQRFVPPFRVDITG